MLPVFAYLANVREGSIHGPPKDESCLIADLFGRLAWQEDSWPEANLEASMFYLRRSKLIRLPQELRSLIPSSKARLDELRMS